MYLIAHKYCGQATLDVATKMLCPECQAKEEHYEREGECDACENMGWWWILNDGHRAYPYWHVDLNHTLLDDGEHETFLASEILHEMPPSALDAYPEPRAAPTEKPPALRGLLTKIGLLPKIERRL